jgi:hypothetical protein
MANIPPVRALSALQPFAPARREVCFRSLERRRTIIDGGRRLATNSRQLAINKPFECRSTAVPLPSFRPMLQSYRVECGPSFYAAKGKTAHGELGEKAWQP